MRNRLFSFQEEGQGVQLHFVQKWLLNKFRLKILNDYIIGMDSDNLLTLKVKIPVQSLQKQILFKNAENFQIALKA